MISITKTTLIAIFCLLVGVVSGVKVGTDISSGHIKGQAINVMTVTDAINHNRQFPLATNAKLQAAAQQKADDMLARQYFDHKDPDGNMAWKIIKDDGICYLRAGENLAEGYKDVETMDQAWMNSPGHKANIVNLEYNQIGVGIAKGKLDGRETTLVVTLFIKQ